MNLQPDEFHLLVELAAERAADGILCLDTDGKILYVNEAAPRTLGLTTATLLDRRIFDIAPDMNVALWRELWKEIRSRSSFAFEFALAGPQERLVHVDMTVLYLKTAPRELACVFFRDIEERKRLQTLQQEFVSTASHELRTPMTVIREGVSQVLEGLRGDINDSQRRALLLALNGIDRLGRMIDEVLDMSKIESGRVTLRRERLDLCALSREVAGALEALAADRRLDLRVETPPVPIMVYADRDRLVQVLTNLVSNSFKFTEQGRIQITIAERAGEAECAVTDTGMGLADADLEKIFNKFEQLEQVAVTGEKGTGLGLSICRGIIELHKGRIWAESAGRGRGTRVTFAIPRQSGAEVFKDQLAPMLRNVARRGGSLSTVIFYLENDALSPASQDQMSSLLGEAELLIRKHSGRKSDILIRDADAMYLALESTVKREAARTAEQVVGAFHDSLSREGLTSRLRMAHCITGFPEDAPDEESYLTKIFERPAP